MNLAGKIAKTDLRITDVLFSSSAKTKCCETKHGTILIATVEEGEIFPGDKITISSEKDGEGEILDAVTMIEINGTEVQSAKPGDKVGLCLRESTLEKIRALCAE